MSSLRRHAVGADGSVTVTPSATNPLPSGQSWSGEVRYRAVDPDGNIGVGMMSLTVVGRG